MRQEEHAEQVALMQWWALSCKSWGIHETLLFSIPNGGFRNLSVAKALKAEGVRSGVPDLFLACPNEEFSGLFIEMKKSKGGRVSDNQKGMIECLNTIGYKAVVCHGWCEARDTIVQYLERNIKNIDRHR